MRRAMATYACAIASAKGHFVMNTPATIRIGAGQSQWLHVEPGLVLVGLAGIATVTDAPRWMSETPVQARAAIHAGQAHAVEARGWVQLSAERPAELSCMQTAAASRTPRPALADLLRTLARRAFA